MDANELKGYLSAAICNAFDNIETIRGTGKTPVVILPLDVAIGISDLLNEWKPKKHESRAMLPCKCGGVRREHWVAPDNELCEELRCKKCGFTVAGKNQTDVIRRWNEAVKRND